MKQNGKHLLCGLLAAWFVAAPAYAGGDYDHAGERPAATVTETGASDSGDGSAAAGGTSVNSSGGTGSEAENDFDGSSGERRSGAASETPSAPKLMVFDYFLDRDTFSAGDTALLHISFYNTNTKRDIRNLKLIFGEEAHEIYPAQVGTAYLRRLEPEGWYEWELDIRALEKATSGMHPVTITMEYEDSDGESYTASDTLLLEIRQPVQLEYDEPKLDARLTQGDTPTFSMQLMNMGKSPVSNVLLTFDLPGIADGGSVLVGTIEPGETQAGTANLRVDEDTLGDVEGSVTLTYEDDFGKTYEKELPLKTTVVERVLTPPQEPEEDKKELSPLQIGGIIAGGLVVVLGLVLILRTMIKNKRAREEDERRL